MLNYRIHGELTLDTPPLVVMHGLLGSLDNWNTFSRKQKGRTVLAIDMRNHGDSPHEQGMSYRLMTDDVLEVLDHLGITVADIMGHSMGGKAGMWLALQHPERVRKLLVVDIAPVSYPPRHQTLLQAMLTMPLAAFKRRREADDWLSPTIKHPLERGFLLKNLKTNEQGRFEWQCNLPEIGRHYLKISAFPDTERVYEGKAVFIDGGKSNYIEDENWRFVLQHFPNASRITIDEAGHLPHVETPEQFVKHVEEALA